MPLSLQNLADMNSTQLVALYTSCAPGEIPDGESQGRAIVMPGTYVGKFLSWVDGFIWQGKVFDRAGGRLVNKILGGLRMVPAQVFHGPSWFDGKESVIIDYRRTSWLVPFIRDEIRQVEPGLYLGRAYMRLPFGRRFLFLWFALDFRK